MPDGGLADAYAPVVPRPAADENAVATLECLAALRRDLRLRLLHEALKRVSRPAQQEILFEGRMQAGQSDPYFAPLADLHLLRKGADAAVFRPPVRR